MPIVKFADFIQHRKEFVRIDDFAMYTRARVQLHWRGIIVRDQIEGAAIKTKTQQVARDGELLVAEIDAKVGGIGIVPPSVDGAIVSSHYFLFEIDEDKCLRSWLDYHVRSGALEDQITARGSTNYAAIRPHHVLNFEIPLPSLDEQRRIVARIDKLSAKIEEARSLRERAVEEVDALATSVVSTVFDPHHWPFRTVENLIGRANLKNGISLKRTTLPSDVHCLALSAMRYGRIDCSDSKPAPMMLTEAEPYLVHREDVYIVRGNGSKNLVARAGLVEAECEGVIFPDLFIRVSLDREVFVPKFFVSIWNSHPVRSVLEDKARTTSGVWKVNQGHIASVVLPVPSLLEQRRIVAYLDGLQAKVDNLKTLQEETAKELDALLSSILSKAFNGESGVST